MDKGYVLNIQQYSLHDGPGIRTVVFLKGCPLRCKWCSNPESQSFQPEIAYDKRKCIGKSQCGRCENHCLSGGVQFDDQGIAYLDHNKCANCLDLAEVCPSQAISVYGKEYRVKELLEVVEKENSFYARSGGGLTLSGGEPLAQPDFAIKLLKEAKKKRINTAIETCGYVSWEIIKEAAQYVDTIIYDMKSMDPQKHEEYTGVSNKLILDNFNKLSKAYPYVNKIVRTPVIPNFNHSEEEIEKIFKFVKDHPNTTYELLTYHRFGQTKYEYLGKQYTMGQAKVDEKTMEKLKRFEIKC